MVWIKFMSNISGFINCIIVAIVDKIIKVSNGRYFFINLFSNVVTTLIIPNIMYTKDTP